MLATNPPTSVTPDDGVHVAHLSKSFPGTLALDDVTITLRQGRIHGVLGENGAGKSTLFKVLAGYYDPDAGSRLYVNGQEQRLPLTPLAANRLGFAFVHQDLALAESLTVMENVCVGAMRTRFGRILWREQAQVVDGLMRDFGVHVSARREVRTLSQAEKAVVAIARAMYARGRGRTTLLVLDEPTANLTGNERDRLVAAMRRAAALGTAVAFSTHRIDEVLAITDEITVLRDGRVAAHREVSDVLDEAELVRYILGRDLEAFYPKSEQRAEGQSVLRVRDLRGQNVDGITFDLYGGEILGITGLAGSGHDNIPSLIVGARLATGGQVQVGDSLETCLTPRTASALGIGYLPADRKRQSGLLSASIRENMTLLSLSRFAHLGRLDHRAERSYVLSEMNRFDVRPHDDCERRLGALSGGNQQKVLLAKWLTKPGLRCMILHEPTQGVDVGAKRAILGVIAELARHGIAVLLVSSEHEELSHLCDRVLVMRNGRMRIELAKPTAERISEQCLVA